MKLALKDIDTIAATAKHIFLGKPLGDANSALEFSRWLASYETVHECECESACCTSDDDERGQREDDAKRETFDF